MKVKCTLVKLAKHSLAAHNCGQSRPAYIHFILVILQMKLKSHKGGANSKDYKGGASSHKFEWYIQVKEFNYICYHFFL